jgi:hypothetical protein
MHDAMGARVMAVFGGANQAAILRVGNVNGRYSGPDTHR